MCTRMGGPHEVTRGESAGRTKSLTVWGLLGKNASPGPRAGTRPQGLDTDAGQGRGGTGSSQLCTHMSNPPGCPLRPLRCTGTPPRPRPPAPSFPLPRNRQGQPWRPPGGCSQAQQAQMVPGFLGRIKRLAPEGTGARAGTSCTVQPATLPDPTAALSWASALGRALPGLPSTWPPTLRHLKMSSPCCPAPKLSPWGCPSTLALWLGLCPHSCPDSTAYLPKEVHETLLQQQQLCLSPCGSVFCFGYSEAILLVAYKFKILVCSLWTESTIITK